MSFQHFWLNYIYLYLLLSDTPLPVLANECQGDIIVGGSNAIHQASWTVPEFNHETSVHKNYGGSK